MKYKDHDIMPYLNYFLVFAPEDWDCYQIPFSSIKAAKEAIDKEPEFLLSESHRCTSAEMNRHPVNSVNILS